MTVLSVENVEKSYRTGGLFSRSRKQVLHGVSFEWKAGECLGVIGESGSGKSTLGRLLLGIEAPDRGRITFDGKRVTDRKTRIGNISAVFQDYSSSMNPYYKVEDVVAEPLRGLAASRAEAFVRVERLLEQVGLNASFRSKYPHELSGGQAQRVCIARAIATRPRCIVLDEAVSSLDGSVQIQILDLLKDLQTMYGMGYIFVTHDIQAAAYLCDRILFLRSGHAEEIVGVDRLKDVQTPYAKQLLRKIIT